MAHADRDLALLLSQKSKPKTLHESSEPQQSENFLKASLNSGLVLAKNAETRHQVCFSYSGPTQQPNHASFHTLQSPKVGVKERAPSATAPSGGTAADELDATFPSWKSERVPPSPTERSPMKTSASPAHKATRKKDVSPRGLVSRLPL